MTATTAPVGSPQPPASAAWRPGDPAGARRFVSLFTDRPLELEAGGRLASVTVAFETWGTLNDDASNAVLILHALTGDSHAAGPAGPGQPFDGWWDPVIGPGKAIDTNRWFVVCPNVLGGCQGTTGPSSPAPDGRPYGSRFPRITIRDQVAVEIALADALGVDRWAAVVGGSMGGMRAIEWAVTVPERVARVAVIASGATATAEQIGLCSVQLEAVRNDPKFRDGDYYDAADGDGPHAGLGLARRIGHLSYRTEPELQARFGNRAQSGEDPLAGGRYAVESYLDHHADKLAWRFDANSYVVLTEAMNHHDVGRGRGGLAAALRRITAEVVVAGIDTDRLYPLWQQREIAMHLPRPQDVVVIPSPHGHDGFLIEFEPVGALIEELLERTPSFLLL